MTDSLQTAKTRQALEDLRRQVAALEAELAASGDDSQWHPEKFYSAFYATVGFMLGGVAAMASLLLNVVGSTIAGKHPLEIIRVYLTFPLGDQALKLASAEGGHYVIDDGMILALGCCLYIGTGMVLGALFHWLLSLFTRRSGGGARLVWSTAANALRRQLDYGSKDSAMVGGTWHSSCVWLDDGPDGSLGSVCSLPASDREQITPGLLFLQNRIFRSVSVFN
jgi:hypothetical protein